jgi:mono/diheme cytochrome c family protein
MSLIVRPVLGCLALLVALQFVRPGLTNPPVNADLNAPADIRRILRKSCYACHSNETQLSWFDRIVPAYQLVAFDVKKGRTALNFSELGAQSKMRQKAVLFEAVSQIQLGAMPPPRYTLWHREAVVTRAELVSLRRYLASAGPVVVAGLSEIEAANSQYHHWISANSTKRVVSAAPNGITFFPGYRNWKAISSTDRTDTNTLKMVLGNDVAIQAIADHKINPWPDGTVFAKISWSRQPDQNGVLRPGRFEQVAFMIKDRKKYASTAGWGWAQWMGAELKPFGNHADFARECVACHAPLRANDYVFTALIASREGKR